jgi:hypothetical protein
MFVGRRSSVVLVLNDAIAFLASALPDSAANFSAAGELGTENGL